MLNLIHVVFTLGHCETLESRFAGQTLPSGAIPQAVINFHKGTAFQIVNDIPIEDCIKFAVREVVEFEEEARTEGEYKTPIPENWDVFTL